MIDALKADVPELANRVFEVGQPTQTTPKPFGVVREGTRTPVGTHDSRQHQIDVLVYGDQDTFATVDTICRKAVDRLNRQRFVDEATGEQFTLDYAGSPTNEMPDPDFSANYRLLRFDAHLLAFLQAVTGMDPDPVYGLMDFTRAVLPAVQVDAASWTVDNPTPGVYWRLDALMGEFEPTSWGGYQDVRLAGHVIAPSPEVRRETAVRLCTQLNIAQAIALRDGSDMPMRPAEYREEANPYSEGQITLRARVGVLSDRWRATLFPDAASTQQKLNRAILGGNVDMEVRAR